MHRPEDLQAARILDQPSRFVRFEHRRFVSMPLGGRALLQMDQAASTDHSVLRNLRECGEDTNLDRHLGLRPRRHRQNTLLNLPRSLYENLQVLSFTLCERMPLDELLAQFDIDQNALASRNQVNLFA